MLTNAPKGTKDTLPDQVYRWHYVEKKFAEICDRYGYREIRTPVFEHTELINRGVGDTTDIVQKEMYTFNDHGGRSLTLKPEGTSPAVRAFVEHKMYAEVQPTKLSYVTPCFRYEKPQSGRLREFHQFGIEIFGTPNMMADTDVICLAHDFLEEMGIRDVQEDLTAMGIEYVVNPRIVRGLDYYTKTAFEFVSNSIGAQGTVCGGGRYDNLCEELGGPPIPGVGFGLGIERLLMLMDANGVEIPEPSPVEVFIVTMGDKAKAEGLGLIHTLHREGISAQMDTLARNVKGQFKYAARLNARYTIVIGDEEIEKGVVQFKDMEQHEQREIPFGEILKELGK